MAVGLSSQLPSAQPSFGSRPQIQPDRFEHLVVGLKEALGPSSGLDSSDVDVNALMDYMKTYDARESGWVPYALGDSEMAYTRNL